MMKQREQKPRPKYLYRIDTNLVDAERLARLERLIEHYGETTSAALIRRLIDQAASEAGLYDPPTTGAGQRSRR